VANYQPQISFNKQSLKIMRFLLRKTQKIFDVSSFGYNENPEKSAGVAGEVRKLRSVLACILSSAHSDG
jgi:hypothetical protein